MMQRYCAVVGLLVTLAGPAMVGAEAFSGAHEAVRRYFLSDDEPTIKDAHWTQRGVLKLGVVDDGKPRDGLAMYACSVLADYDLPEKRVSVHIIDIGKLVRTGDWVKLGEARCAEI